MAQKNAKNAHLILITKIFPLLEEHPVCIELKRMCEDEKGERNVQEGSLLHLLLATADTIVKRIQATTLNCDNVRRTLCILNSMREFRRENKHASPESSENTAYVCDYCKAPMGQHRPYLLPSYAFGVHEALKNLCHAVVATGRANLLDGYVEIAYTKEYAPPQHYRCVRCQSSHTMTADLSEDDFLLSWRCPQCESNADYLLPLDMEAHMVPYIARFTLIPSETEAHLVDARLAAKNRHNPKSRLKMAYELLCAFAWAWDVDRQVFRNKALRYNDADTCKASKELLELHGMRSDVMATKTKIVITRKSTNEKIVLRPMFCTPKEVQESLLCVMNALGQDLRII